MALQDFDRLSQTKFISLSEAKAKLSEQLRWVRRQKKRLAITSNGQPKAILLAYEDYLDLVKPFAASIEKSAVISYEEYVKEAPLRRELSESVAKLFDLKKLTRKGKKAYKAKRVKLLEPY